MRRALRERMAAGSSPLRLVGGGAPGPAPAGGGAGGRRLLRVLAPLGALVLFALALLHFGAEGRALRRLPPAERAALYHRTLDTLTTVCAGEGKRDLRDLCRRRAELVLLFPECDAACQATAREQLRAPTR
jgi:hypothetical protein